MTWFGGDGWGWCGTVFNAFATAMFWGAVFIAILLAVHVLIKVRSNPPAVVVTGSNRVEGGPPVRYSRGGIGNDDFYRRLM
jgi:uncharacterized membrane protein